MGHPFASIVQVLVIHFSLWKILLNAHTNVLAQDSLEQRQVSYDLWSL